MSKETTIEEAEAENLPPDDGRSPHVPFGFAHAKWLEFKAKIQPGDTLTYFNNPPPAPHIRIGGTGYQITRDGKWIDTFMTFIC